MSSYTANHVAKILAIRKRLPYLKSGNFISAVKAAIVRDGLVNYDLDELDDENFAIIPDLFHIDESRRRIVVIEVEDTSGISDRKMREMWELEDLLQGEGWALKLFVLPRWGHDFVEVSIFSAHYSLVTRDLFRGGMGKMAAVDREFAAFDENLNTYELMAAYAP